jgi:Rrf2 family protein
MLRISKKADYAVFLLGAIAREGAYPGGPAGDAVVSAHEIALKAHLNKSVVANLLKRFAKDGMLESVRGLKGGYRLKKAPDAITLGAILSVVDGPLNLVDCLRPDGSLDTGLDHHCNLIAFCPTKNPMRIVHERIGNLFEQITLAEMCGLSGCPATRVSMAPATFAASHR